jgi:hypothetical protein
LQLNLAKICVAAREKTHARTELNALAKLGTCTPDQPKRKRRLAGGSALSTPGLSFLSRHDVTSTAYSSALDSVRQPHDEEVHLLVELLRTCRLSLLYAELGSDKTSLLRSALVPLLSRRAGDQSIASTPRASGVVVPFPDRRSRSSAHTTRRRREIVIYCGDWTDTPLAALRESLYGTVTTNLATREPSASLSESLEELSRQFDANFVIVLDRFEDVLSATPHQTAIDQFADELAEAINHANLPANFLIALAEDARPRLVGLRSRIPGFDDFSLKLAPPRRIKGAVHPAAHEASAAEALPVLTEALTKPAGHSISARPPELGTANLALRKAKVARAPPPRLQVKTEDVYAMIEAALSRIAAATAARLSVAQPRELPSDIEPQRGALSQRKRFTSPVSTRGKSLEEAIDRMERRLGLTPEDEQDSHR